ncbi:MAG: ComEA family DNA-binding protein [Polyangiales bacterium]
MSASAEGGLRRRLFFVLLVPCALVVLVFIGRPTSNAAPSSLEAGSLDASSDESPIPSASASTNGSGDAASPVLQAVEQQADGAVLVDLNHASEDDLRRLPGVGPQKAKAIVELRTRLGSFKRLEDLARIKGFGRSTLRRLRPFVRITPR